MNIFEKRRSWNASLNSSLRLEDDVREIPGMKEAMQIKDPLGRHEAMLQAAMIEVERMKWLSSLVFQEAARTNRISIGVLAISCIVDSIIISRILGVI